MACAGLVFLLLFAWFASPAPARAQGQDGDKYVLGGSYVLPEGEEITGSLYVFGGSADLETGSRVEGDIYLLGGSLSIDGTVDGDISALGGSLSLGNSAVVEGDLHYTGGSLDRSTGAEIHGEIDQSISGLPFNPLPFRTPRFWVEGNPIFEGLWFFLRAFLWAAGAILAALLFPHAVRRIAGAARSQPVLAVLMGILTAILTPLALILLVITIIGIPAALIAILVLGLVWAFGLVSLGTEVGSLAERALNQNWALPVEAGAGTFLLVVVMNGFGALVPCVGPLAPVLVGLLGIGAVLMTRFGTQPYPPLAGEL